MKSQVNSMLFRCVEWCWG